MNIHNIDKEQIEELKTENEKLARQIGIIEENEELQFRGVKFVFTAEDESFKAEAKIVDEDFEDEDFE